MSCPATPRLQLPFLKETEVIRDVLLERQLRGVLFLAMVSPSRETLA